MHIYACVKETTAVPDTSAQGAAPKNKDKKVIFKSCALFINSIIQINNTEVDDAHDINVVKPMYNLIEYSDIYSKTSGVYGNTIEMNQL